jgi:hypothetical protein
MRCRILLTAVVTAALLASACSGAEPTAPAPATGKSESTSATAQSTERATAAPAETTPADAPPPAGGLGGDACVAITGANLDLAVATNNDDARKAGDTFEKYDPPADVREAIEHFVSTGGAQFDDPDYDRYNTLIDNWVRQVCPL